MNWDDLRIIQAVCRTGSFTRAARSLHLNETTIGRRVVRLEEDLGVRLFDAVDGERRPTAACQAVIDKLNGMEDAVADIESRLRSPHQTVRKLRLTTIPAIAEHVLAPRMGELFDVIPELSLTIDTSVGNADMSRWEADVAIRLGRPQRGTFLMRKIGSLNFWLIGPADPAAANRILVYPGTFLDAPEMQALLARTHDSHVSLETADLAVMAHCLATGAATGVLPDFLVDLIPADAPVVRTPLPVSRDIWLLSQPHLRDDVCAKKLYDWCRSLFLSGSIKDASHTKACLVD